MRSPAVPFTIDKVHGGLSRAHGHAFVDGEELVLEMQTMLLSFVKQQPKTYRFDLVDLESVRHKRSLMGGDTITLRTRPLDVVADLPGAENGGLKLCIKRAHRAEVDALLEYLDLWLVK